MSDSQHTPKYDRYRLPWYENTIETCQIGNIEGPCCYVEDAHLVPLVIRAVNSHDALLAACKRAMREIPIFDRHQDSTRCQALLLALQVAIDQAEAPKP